MTRAKRTLEQRVMSMLIHSTHDAEGNWLTYVRGKDIIASVLEYDPLGGRNAPINVYLTVTCHSPTQARRVAYAMLKLARFGHLTTAKHRAIYPSAGTKQINRHFDYDDPIAVGGFWHDAALAPQAKPKVLGDIVNDPADPSCNPEGLTEEERAAGIVKPLW